MDEYNAIHETMEVVTFCDKRGTTLNARVVQVRISLSLYISKCHISFPNTNVIFLQILEHYAKVANKQKDLEGFLLKCVQITTDEIEEICNGSVEALIRRLKVKMNTDDVEFFDSSTLYRMCAALVNTNDPERNRLCSMYLFHTTHAIKGKQ